jgi:hypothetical protein
MCACGTIRIAGRLTLAMIALLALVGCVSARCGSARSEEPVLEVRYSTGGPGPVRSSVTLTEGKHLIYISLQGRTYCGALDPSEVELLKDLAMQEQLKGAAKDAQRQGHGYFDYEEISIETTSWTAIFPLELTPPQVHELLDSLNVVLHRHFGIKGPWERET